MADICARPERNVDVLLIDEVQGFAGHDVNFLPELCSAGISVLLAGDDCQQTFDTSRDGNTNVTLDDNITCQETCFTEAGMLPDRKTLIKTWRCSQTVGEFISSDLHIPVVAHIFLHSRIETVNDHEQVTALCADDGIIKLFYREHHRYGCYSLNWGVSKGLDHFNDICIVMGSTHWKLLTDNHLKTMKPVTRNKLYVACSRARGNIRFVPEKLLRSFR
ncbi:DNA helicase UvrD [Pantoea sp. B623]|uniref:DNA helicase UvrD n=1 Tax=Pantoea sp. B623 TaxID=2974561 RepID=UPI002166C229|nr:DNA helicase UvrD [Pantoea sp. B623]MCS4492691.1 DNA helicase UvrD [Pantoea sp. B623]